MGVLTTAEETIMSMIGATFNGTIRKKDTLPGGWTMDLLTRALQFAPGVYVAFLGARPGSAGFGHYDGTFAVYTVTKGAIEPDRRRGNQRVIGAYEMIELLVPRLDGLGVDDVGHFHVTGVDNLFRDAMFDLGGTVYGINLTLPNMPIEYIADESGLEDFLRTYVDYDLAPTDGTIDASDQIDLPQE